MAKFDYDVVIIGSGFGGSVAALPAVEKRFGLASMALGSPKHRAPACPLAPHTWHRGIVSEPDTAGGQ